MKKSLFRRGFTLIELLVVISIIGLLSSIIIASLKAARDQAEDGRQLSNVRQIQLALELYFNDHGAYPVCPNQAEVCCIGGTTCMNADGIIGNEELTPLSA